MQLQGLWLVRCLLKPRLCHPQDYVTQWAGRRARLVSLHSVLGNNELSPFRLGGAAGLDRPPTSEGTQPCPPPVSRIGDSGEEELCLNRKDSRLRAWLG